MSGPAQAEAHGGAPASGGRDPRQFAGLALGALGVVYGDIGTSPLYALRECVNTGPGGHGVPPTPENVLGLLSLVLWALLVAVTGKYLGFVLRADNQGEGGILALFALVEQMTRSGRNHAVSALLLLGLFGAGLLVGDGVITPVVSVFGAVEGLEVVTPALEPLVVPITCAILIALFAVQRSGTGRIGRAFGPVMAAWFLALAVAGLNALRLEPGVLAAVNPLWALRFMAENGAVGFLLLGSVVLVITGAEALYADLGHFGRAPIRAAWLAVALPALLLNYFGQGAALLRDPSVATNPFYALAPGWTLYPMLALATAAAVIASQALISGVFSLTRQAVQLGLWPRARIVHTSAAEEGQIYVPEVNWALLVACLVLALEFGGSSALAAAYGVSVTGTMVITSLLFAVVARVRFGWSLATTGLMLAAFLAIDLSFFAANLAKLFHGGWLPLLMGAAVFTIMTTWRTGRMALANSREMRSLPLDLFLADVAATRPLRVPGTAVVMSGSSDGAPVVLLHHFKHNRTLHARIVLFNVATDRRPRVHAPERVKFVDLGAGFFRVDARVGFMQDPDVPGLLREARAQGLEIDLEQASYFLGRESLLTNGPARLARWRKALFAFLSRNARPATQFFGLPPNRVVELGAQVEL
jgi:KUP system potassium uptake protein